MNELLNELDLVELGKRCCIVRKRLGFTQMELAKELGTSQYQISRLEKGGQIMSSLMLRLLLLYSKSISLDTLFAKSFNSLDENILDSHFLLNDFVKEKMKMVGENIDKQLEDCRNEIKRQIEDSLTFL